ncbi:hypothetical protein VIGAN_05231400 [Vigna angularis var. angularis]|uniref:Uncharacterized protein n=1 Tax=Vigna angularis var. angularis TaxID=157739 RepID=A0A0S3S7A1_PHAAN|nr:uncharacterized protein LOC108344096 isoform X4 [Vigna angularis]BAT88726.1 hypothetical protein VIGAN_05231400 [Vigna angularis var. angularis]
MAASTSYVPSTVQSSPTSSPPSSSPKSPTESARRSINSSLPHATATFHLRAFSTTVTDKPSVCTADELHYVSLSNSDWKLALWNYNPSLLVALRNIRRDALKAYDKLEIVKLLNLLADSCRKNLEDCSNECKSMIHSVSAGMLLGPLLALLMF